MSSVDAIVIGAGVIGAAIALELSRAGKKTLVVDRLPAAGYGSTSNSCAIIRVYYSTVDATALAYESWFYWKRWRDYLTIDDPSGLEPFPFRWNHLNDQKVRREKTIERSSDPTFSDSALAVYHDTGTLLMRTEENGYCERTIEIARDLGIPFELWDAERIGRALPAYRLDRFAPAKLMDDERFGEATGGEIENAVFFPRGGYVSDPQLATRNLQTAAEARGCRFLFGRRVREIPTAGGRVAGVVLDDGSEIAARVVVNVAGPHSAIVNKMAGADRDMRITTRPLRQEVVHLKAPEDFGTSGSKFVVSDSDIAVYSRPEIGDNILVGSEDPPCDRQEEVDPDDFDRSIGEQGRIQALRYAQRVPSLGVPTRPGGVVDLYDVTEDWGPVYDRSCVDGFYMAVGTSGNQFKNAPVVGKMMTALIEHCERGGDHDTVPLRFALSHIDHMLDMRNFSRLREINAGSTFSVLG